MASLEDPHPVLFTRRSFLQASAAAAAAVSVPWAVGCGGDEEGDDSKIVAAAIHPAIGIARVGNSKDSFFFGPEVPGTAPRAPGGFKDPEGAIARQAARFRVYGLDKDGNVVRELTAPGTKIDWRVHVANTKAAWYEFETAFDIPDAQPAPRRNNDITGADRVEQLISDPGERAIAGTAQGPVRLSGEVFGQQARLGELLTDVAGRLVFLPGRGRGYTNGTNPLTSFASNNGWSDDVCDGTVRARIKLGDRTIEAEPAWIVSTPPNYGPAMQTGLVTAYDAARSMFATEEGGIDAGKVEFANDILPIFTRLTDMQWVNEGFFESNGFGSDADWNDPERIAKLADGSPSNRAYRRKLFKQFRNPAFRKVQPDKIPDMYGDGVSFTDLNPRMWLAVTPFQYEQLRRWSEGQFESGGAQDEPQPFDKLPVAQQPEALDRAALESCLGGAFHPGIEAPWVLRRESVWEKPYRLKLAGNEPNPGDYGSELTSKKVFAADGPLDGCTPGALTRWLGVPWHTDAASCRSGYQRSVSTVSPTFWPARIPTQVLSESDYDVVMDKERSLDERKAAFAERRDWERFIARPERPETLELMMNDWPKLGMITDKPGPGDADFPKRMKVESLVGFTSEPPVEYGADLWVPQVPAPQAE